MHIFLTADARRRTQTFLSRDPRDKKYVNHANRVIKYSFLPKHNQIIIQNSYIMPPYYKPVCPKGMQVFLPTGRREEKILSASVCVGLRLIKLYNSEQFCASINTINYCSVQHATDN